MTVKELLRAAQRRLDRQDLTGAIELFEKASRQKPDDEDILKLLEEARQALAGNETGPASRTEGSETEEVAPNDDSRRIPDLSRIHVTRVAEATPTGFFQDPAFPTVNFFASHEDLLKSIHKSFDFYRDHLDREFKTLSRQADIVFWIWIGCVVVAFVALVAGIAAMFLRPDLSGAVTTASSVLLLFFQRIFQKREDDYRTRADKKARHLEYGNQWLLVIQSIDAMPESDAKRERQERLAEILTDKLQGEVRTVTAS